MFTCVANQIVQDDHLFKLFLELLLQCCCPLETRTLAQTLSRPCDAPMETASLILLTVHAGGRPSPRPVISPLAVGILCHWFWPWMVPHKDVGVLESIQEELETSHFVWQRLGAMLCLSGTSIEIVVVERGRRQPNHLSARDNIEFESPVDQRCCRLGDIAKVRDQTGKEKEKISLENWFMCYDIHACQGRIKVLLFLCIYQLRPKQHGKRLRWIHLAHLGLSCP